MVLFHTSQNLTVMTYCKGAHLIPDYFKKNAATDMEYSNEI